MAQFLFKLQLLLYVYIYLNISHLQNPKVCKTKKKVLCLLPSSKFKVKCSWYLFQNIIKKIQVITVMNKENRQATEVSKFNRRLKNYLWYDNVFTWQHLMNWLKNIQYFILLACCETWQLRMASNILGGFCFAKNNVQ